MMNFIQRSVVLMLLAGVACFSSCQDPWKDHNETKLQALDKTLLTVINENPDLSVFSGYLKQTGYDKVLESSKTFTVWAPENSALQNLDQSVLNDAEKLKAFVANHISNQAYFTDTPNPSVVIRMLNGKNTVFSANDFDGAGLIDKDLYVKNGVLHTIDEALTPKPNAWEYLQSSALGAKQAAFIASLSFTELDTSQGVKLYTDPVTGENVYQEGTVFPVQRNRYFKNVGDISSEDSLVTVIILNDAAFDAEVNKLKAYNVTADPEAMDSLSRFMAVKDLVINGFYEDVNNLPDSLVATTGVRVHLDKANIVETVKLSNGVAYVVNQISYETLENKVPNIIIQGEFLDSLKTPRNPVYKLMKDPANHLFTQIQVADITSSPNPLYYFRYKTKVHSTRYAVYWRSVNDVYETPFSMAVKFDATRKYDEFNIATTDYAEVPPYDANDPQTYGEKLVGYVTADSYGTIYAYLISSLGASSSAPTALSLDYIKLVPVNN